MVLFHVKYKKLATVQSLFTLTSAAFMLTVICMTYLPLHILQIPGDNVILLF